MSGSDCCGCIAAIDLAQGKPCPNCEELKYLRERLEATEGDLRAALSSAPETDLTPRARHWRVAVTFAVINRWGWSPKEATAAPPAESPMLAEARTLLGCWVRGDAPLKSTLAFLGWRKKEGDDVQR